MKKCAAFLFVALGWGVGAASAQDRELPPGWFAGPMNGKLGTHATITVPDGYMFLNQQATRTFLEENQNIPDGDELGTLVRVLPDEKHWFAVFSYADTGHIDNSERNSLDADKLMESMRQGNYESNEERKKRGWSPLVLIDWQVKPYYDQKTHNLTWATLLASDNEPVINHSVRLLGRTGLMSAQLVADPSIAETATAEFNEALKGYTFNSGRRYFEFRDGDKLAGYGLTALIAGGAGAAAVKTGVFKKLGKLIVVGVVGLIALVKKLFGVLTGNRDEADPASATR
jgi:uncharacterized membrane-anchored protein